MQQIKAEIEYKFSLKQNYSLLIQRDKEVINKMRGKPAWVAGVIIFLTPIISRTEYGFDRDTFWFLISLAIVCFGYLKLKYNDKIKSTERQITQWQIEADLQEKYVNYLFQLEESSPVKFMP